MAQRTTRRNFLSKSSAGVGGLLAIGGLYDSRAFGDELETTAQTTAGPFYPQPDIKSKTHIDTDLTRLSDDAELADGEVVVVRGSVVDVEGKPLVRSFVEVWQADNNGRYDHPGENNHAPIDQNFQHWGRMLTDELGRFAFRTIKPGKYPGRTPHIHFFVDANKHEKLTTQMYFESYMDANRKDGLFNRMSKSQQAKTTIAFSNATEFENIPVGNFQLVLGDAQNERTTPSSE
jgi:protocatechuate 3,4-dioxygenase beta subunit